MISDFTRHGVKGRRSPQAARSRPASGVPIGHERDGGLVLWPRPSRAASAHVIVFGSSGAGKSVLVASALVREMQQNQEAAYLIIDPKGDLIDLLLSGLCAIAPERLGDIHLLDPFSPEAFPWNLNHLALGARTPIDIRALAIANLVSTVSTSMGSRKDLATGSRQTDVLLHVLLGALACDRPGASPLLALDALASPAGFDRLAAMTRSRRAAQFLRSAKPHPELLSSCSARLRLALAATDSIEEMMSAPGCVQFDELLAPGSITLVQLGAPYGGVAALQVFFAQLFVRLAVEHLLNRPSPFEGHHCRLVIDECQIVVPVLVDVAQTLLETGRSRGISLVQLTQSSQGLRRASEDYLYTVLANSKIMLCGRLAVEDAELIARSASVQPGGESASVVRSRLASRLSNLPDRCFYRFTPGGREAFTSLEVPLEEWQSAREQQATRIEAIRRRHALVTPGIQRLRLGNQPDQPRAAEHAEPTERPPQPRSPWG